MLKILKEKIYKIPIYNKKILFDEAKLFLDWYAPKVLINKKLKMNI